MNSSWLLNLVVLLLAAPLCAAETTTVAQSKASAALSLAKAKREREAVQLVAKKLAAPTCHTDYAVAAKEAADGAKPLVVWVGMKCEDRPALRKELDSAVHCHVATANGSNVPRVLISGGDGVARYYPREKLGDDTAAKIKAAWSLPTQPPPVRRDIGIEESGRLPFAMPATTALVAAGTSLSSQATTPTARTLTAAPTAAQAGGIRLVREPLLMGRRQAFYQGMDCASGT